jgi:hypothetical protein
VEEEIAAVAWPPLELVDEVGEGGGWFISLATEKKNGRRQQGGGGRVAGYAAWRRRLECESGG